MTAGTIITEQPAAATKRTARGVLFRSALLAAGIVLLAEVLRMLTGGNTHALAPGRCFRAGQPNPEALGVFARRFGVRSVINLRGNNVSWEWYREEHAAAGALGLQITDAGMGSYVQPKRTELWRLVEAIDASPEPVLIHCHSGSDRTGLASALYLLLRTDADVATARRQLGLRYGHFSWGKAGCLGRLVDGYAAWLRDEGGAHSSVRFRRWALEVYEPE